MNDSLKNNMISYSTTTYETLYSPASSFSTLGTAEHIQLSVVVKGCGIHQLLNQISECQAGDMYILGSGIQHGYFAKSETEKPTVCTLTFDPSALYSHPWADPNNPLFCYGVFRNHIPVSYAMLNSYSMKEFSDIFSDIVYELEHRDIQWLPAVSARLTTLLISIARYINMANTSAMYHPEEWLTVSAAMRLALEQCSNQDMTLESIASALFVSQSSLSRMFQKVTGDSFIEYIRKVRVNLACTLLRTSSLTNEQIVTRCGLKDVPSFYRVFKKYMGTTPYQYRISQQTYEGESIMQIYIEISQNVQKGKSKIVKELVQKAIEDGMPAAMILNEGLLDGMNVIGEKFKNNEVYVPEVLVAARAMNMGMQILKPLLVEDGVQATGKVCIGTVQGDLHDIGKNLVKMMMEGKGLEVVDLGTDVSPSTFVQTAIDQHCQVICCSALLTTTMGAMEDVVKAAEAAGIRDKVKIMVGGAPVNDEFCRQIGADAYTPDAASAAEAAVAFCS